MNRQVPFFEKQNKVAKCIYRQVSVLPVYSVSKMRAIDAVGITVGADLHLNPIQVWITFCEQPIDHRLAIELRSPEDTPRFGHCVFFISAGSK
jgi:hypothetical protein